MRLCCWSLLLVSSAAVIVGRPGVACGLSMAAREVEAAAMAVVSSGTGVDGDAVMRVVAMVAAAMGLRLPL